MVVPVRDRAAPAGPGHRLTGQPDRDLVTALRRPARDQPAAEAEPSAHLPWAETCSSAPTPVTKAERLDVVVLLEQLTQRGRDLPLRQDAGRALVEQRLEQVVLSAVDQGDLDRCPLQPPGREQAGET